MKMFGKAHSTATTPVSARATVEWAPATHEHLRVSLLIEQPFDEAEAVLRLDSERLVCNAYPEVASGSPSDISISPHRRLHGIRVPIRLETLTPLDGSHGAVVSIRWTARRWGHLFPGMEADLLLRPLGRKTTCLILECRYQPPLALVGLIFDWLIGRWIAAATAEDFLVRFAGQAFPG
jgi:hypothetical protein